MPPVFHWLGRQGGVAPEEMARAFNCGIGMAVVVAPDRAAEIERVLSDAGESVHRIGEIVPRAEAGPGPVSIDLSGLT